MAIVWFLIGLMAGGVVGVFAMCLMQVHRLHGLMNNR